MPEHAGNMTEQKTEPGSNGPSVLKRAWPFLLILALALAAAAGGYWWFFQRGRVTTDDAYVKADSAAVSSRVEGTVTEILVDNDYVVEEGRILLKLDPADFELSVARAEAVLARVEAEMESARLGVGLANGQTRSQVQAAEAALGEARNQKQALSHRVDELRKRRAVAEADLANARREFQRYESLYRQGSGSEQTRDNARTALEKAEAVLKAVDSEIESVKSSLEALQQQIRQAEAKVAMAWNDREQVPIQRLRLQSLEAQRKEAAARLEQAALDLSYCVIRAPIAGQIAQKGVQVGNRVKPAQPLMAVVPLHAVYVEANFKESQLKDIRPGQEAEVEADVFPGRSFRGRVSGIRAGTGAAFSLLPAENATGNWVKIVQRVPVRIELDRPLPPDYPLRVGLSLTVTVRTGGTPSEGTH